MSCTSPLRIEGGCGRPLFATSLAKDLRHDYQHPSPSRFCLSLIAALVAVERYIGVGDLRNGD